MGLAMVTFMIGNGFDIQAGLETKYTDFYKVYTQKKDSDSKNIRRFKEEILKAEAHGWSNWADFELQMGKHSVDFTGETQVEDFIECFDNFVVSFNEYLEEQCSRVDWSNSEKVNKIVGIFANSIKQFYNNVKSSKRKDISSILGYNCYVNFLQFNYTDIFDRLLEKSLHWIPRENTSANGRVAGITRYLYNLHVHGKINGGYPTIGVNDVSQILNPVIRDNHRVQTIFVKPKFLDALQSRDVNVKSVRDQALEVIRGSIIICAFGTSIGETDEFWWGVVGEWLKNNGGKLIIFDICGATDDGTSPLIFLNSQISVEDRKSEIMNKVLKAAKLSPDWLEANPERVIVELDSGMFGFTELFKDLRTIKAN